MKIRNGFVSNSSSSSFIISNDNFPNVRSLAKYMLKQKIKEYNIDYSDVDNIDMLYIKKLSKIDADTPICFPSCNYDTYIKKIGDCYLVSTCNNTNWDLYEYTTKLTNNARDELINIKNDKSVSDEYCRSIEYILEGDHEFYEIGNDYYNLSNDIIGVETDTYCSNHKKEIHKNDYSPYLWNTKKWGLICPKCNPVIKREKKLNIINKNIKNGK